jgi:primosomal protein N' (replication factor Y)
MGADGAASRRSSDGGGADPPPPSIFAIQNPGDDADGGRAPPPMLAVPVAHGSGGSRLLGGNHPEHEALQALVAGDRDMFIGVEMAMREMLGLPPYGRIAAVIIWGPDKKKAKALAVDFVTKAPRTDGIEILGPSEAPISRLRGLYRYRLFVTAENGVNLSKYMAAWRAKAKVPTKYKIHVDIDPQSFV